MLDWHLCQIYYSLEIKIVLLLLLSDTYTDVSNTAHSTL